VALEAEQKAESVVQPAVQRDSRICLTEPSAELSDQPD
jgi:hypothetical protein